jgi:ADP-ribose pyrophosphatase
MTFDKTTDDVEIIRNHTVFDGYFSMSEYHLRHRTHDGGWSETMSREVFQRGPVVAVLPYDAKRDRLVMIEQFRIGAYAAIRDGIIVDKSESPWLLECVAGVVEDGEAPEDVARRELMEEANCQALDIFHVNTWHASPGAINEPIAFYCANVDSSTSQGIHGLDHEDEDIRVFTVSPQTAIDWLDGGTLSNGMTIIALQWFALNHKKLQQRWA